MAATAPRKVINRRVRYEAEHHESTKAGHPFFPYAMFHDTVVNLIVVLVIVAMAIIWHATAGPINQAHPTGQAGWLGELYQTKANPAVQATEPRPDWYFLFLFELLRIFKTPWQLIFATIIIPTVMMVLLVVWPFIDRGRDRRLSRRPVAVAVGLTVPTVLIALTMAGARAPGVLASGVVTSVPAWDKTQGAQLIAGAGCTGCHGFGNNSGPGPGINLKFGTGSPKFGTDVKGLEDWISVTASQQAPPMPSFKARGYTPQQIQLMAEFVAALKTNKPPAQ